MYKKYLFVEIKIKIENKSIFRMVLKWFFINLKQKKKTRKYIFFVSIDLIILFFIFWS
jgi:hypothetical protein